MVFSCSLGGMRKFFMNGYRKVYGFYPQVCGIILGERELFLYNGCSVYK